MNRAAFRIGLSLVLLSACTGCPSNDTPAQDAQARRPRALDRTVSIDPQAPTRRARVRATNVRAGGVRDITFDDLEFPIERDQAFAPAMITDKIHDLAGRTVILRGFILASTIFQQTGITQFVLVRDNQECCFGPGAYIYHNAQIEMIPPKTATFSIRPVTVHGTFSIKPYTVEGTTYSVFHIAADRVE